MDVPDQVNKQALVVNPSGSKSALHQPPDPVVFLVEIESVGVGELFQQFGDPVLGVLS